MTQETPHSDAWLNLYYKMGSSVTVMVWMRNVTPIALGIGIFGPQMMVLFCRFRRCVLVGGSTSLEVDFESSRTHALLSSLSLPCA